METATYHLSPEERFQMLMETACDYAIFFMDPAGEIREWSRGAEKILGYAEDEALRVNGRVIFTPEDQARGAPEREMARAVADGQANDERWHVRKNGERFFAIGRLVALRDEAGAFCGFAKIIRDATPSKALEDALHASDAHFRAIFAQAPLGMVLTDLEGRVRQVNEAFCRLSGFSEKDLGGRELGSLFDPDERAQAKHVANELLDGRRTSTLVERRLARRDGTTVWVQCSGALLRDAQGLPLSFIDLFQDISLLKMSAVELGQLVDQRTAALHDKTKQMESFCYTVAHDLRAPLRAIAGYAEFLRSDFEHALPGQGMEYVRRIEAAAARLDRLINDLLGYTRVQQVPLIQEDVELTDVVQRVAEQARRDHGLGESAIVVEAPLGRVRADRVTLDHVFVNLVSNAIKFRRDDAPLAVRIHSERRGGRLRVWVDDNGIGIDPRFKDRAFGMFERLHPERRIAGTGVGLAIVATAMERLGGSRGVEPNSPHGSRFWLEFPQ